MVQLPVPDPHFVAFAQEHRPSLLSTAWRLTGNGSDAHDLVQDTLERALRRFTSLSASGNPRGWLFAILHNLFVDRCRGAGYERAALEQLASQVSMPAPEDRAVWESLTPEQIRAAVSQLPEEFQSVYALHAEQKSYAEIAETLGIPKVTVGTRLVRARRRLKEILLGRGRR